MKRDTDGMRGECGNCIDVDGGEDCQYCAHANKGDGRDYWRPDLSKLAKDILTAGNDKRKL